MHKVRLQSLTNQLEFQKTLQLLLQIILLQTHLLLRTINTRIIKLDTSDHFPIFLIAEAEKTTPEGKV